PSCSRAIIDEAHQLEDVATQHFGFSVSNYRFEELARDVQKAAGSRTIEDPDDRAEIDKAVARLRNHASAFFNEVAFAHRGDGRLKSEERVRATPESLGPTLDAAAHLTGALDILESTLQLVRLPPSPQGGYGVTGPPSPQGGYGVTGPPSRQGGYGVTATSDDDASETDFDDALEDVQALVRRA